MELRGEGDKKTFYCSCGYRERLENFQNRKEDKVNKKDVNTFLRKQNTDENINSALAEALSKWKEKK